MATYTNNNGSMRFYDSSATPYYVDLPFDNGDWSAPEGKARPVENLRLDRGTLSTDAHYTQGPDEVILEPQSITGTFILDELHGKTKLRQILNADALKSSAWVVGSNTWATTKGDTSLVSGLGASVTTPAFADKHKQCVNLEIIWDDPDESGAIGQRYAEVYFPPDQQNIQESADGVVLSLNGLIYGTITEITAFSSGSAG